MLIIDKDDKKGMNHKMWNNDSFKLHSSAPGLKCREKLQVLVSHLDAQDFFSTKSFKSGQMRCRSYSGENFKNEARIPTHPPSAVSHIFSCVGHSALEASLQRRQTEPTLYMETARRERRDLVTAVIQLFALDGCPCCIFKNEGAMAQCVISKWSTLCCQWGATQIQGGLKPVDFYFWNTFVISAVLMQKLVKNHI